MRTIAACGELPAEKVTARRRGGGAGGEWNDELCRFAGGVSRGREEAAHLLLSSTCFIWMGTIVRESAIA